MTRRATPERIALAAALALTGLAGLALAARGGYSPDEELTLFAVQGIRDTGVPALPSGLTYWRGPLFSYAAWAAGAGLGFTLESYRAVSIVASGLAVVCTVAIARRLSSQGAVAAVLLAAMPAFMAITPYARFYSPLVAAMTAALFAVTAGRSIWVFAVLALAARGFHELGATAILIPLVCALAGVPLHRSYRRAANACIVTIALVAAHFLLATLQRRGIGGETAAAPWAWLGAPVPLLQAAPLLPTATSFDWIAIATIFGGMSWWVARRLEPTDRVFVIVCAACAALLSLGTITVAAVFWLIVRPARWRQSMAVAFGMAIAGGLTWAAVIGVRTDTLVTPRFIVDLFEAGLRTHLDGARVLAGQLPIATALCAFAMLPAGGMQASTTVRAVAALLWLQTIMLGIFGIDVRTRFLAVMAPAMAILAALGIARVAAALRTPPAASRLMAATAMAVLLTVVVLEQQRVVRGLLDRPLTAAWWSAWAPPAALTQSTDDELAATVAGDVIVTNDELAALLLVRRADYWWTTDNETAAFYGRRYGERLHGIYARLPALVGEPALRTLPAPSSRAISVIWFNSSKFGGVPPAFHEPSSWPAGTIFQLTPDWFLVRMPPVSSPH